ncbi:MAG: sigma-54 interaction domain-containing protein [Stenotrophobium sp.]
MNSPSCEGCRERDSRIADLQARLSELERVQRERTYLREQSRIERDLRALTGESAAMKAVRLAIQQVAATDSTVLIRGETGTGKELVARAIHQLSSRRDRLLVAVNCAALAPSLIASELFGHEAGAFTGATRRRFGRFELAHQGTIFLDEVGELAAEMQVMLLRVLQERVIERVGGSGPLAVDVRVIAATHQDLETLVQEGRFRDDLYHRLNVIRVRIPPLRERHEDIPLLLRHFLARAAAELKTEAKRLRPEVLAHLRNFAWPGNVRQMENIARWLTVMAPGQDIHTQDLPPELRPAGSAKTTLAVPPESRREPKSELELASAATQAAMPSGDWPELLRLWAEQQFESGANDVLGTATPQFERALIEVALKACHGQRQEAARRLGWGRNTLTRKIKELGMD